MHTEQNQTNVMENLTTQPRETFKRKWLDMYKSTFELHEHELETNRIAYQSMNRIAHQFIIGQKTIDLNSTATLTPFNDFGDLAFLEEHAKQTGSLPKDCGCETLMWRPNNKTMYACNYKMWVTLGHSSLRNTELLARAEALFEAVYNERMKWSRS